jgi:pimeloyl-ACP methyl ester carboxylesterase
MSLGAALVPDLLAFEDRFRGAILYSGGFGVGEKQPEIDDRTALAGRIRMPILMLGGRHDANNPVEPHQQALFRAFGTPDELKAFQVFDSGHWPLPMAEVLRETVDFLDLHNGPVTVPPI